MSSSNSLFAVVVVGASVKIFIKRQISSNVSAIAKDLPVKNVFSQATAIRLRTADLAGAKDS